ncbi:unnamed protein product [Linum trigynum]|uniref:Uncharacterized protein n=1 Tax=Linum trigynum TaxID=586398 RepID=A0AAV2FXE0_9ROSI
MEERATNWGFLPLNHLKLGFAGLASQFWVGRFLCTNFTKDGGAVRGDVVHWLDGRVGRGVVFDRLTSSIWSNGGAVSLREEGEKRKGRIRVKWSTGSINW